MTCASNVGLLVFTMAILALKVTSLLMYALGEFSDAWVGNLHDVQARISSLVEAEGEIEDLQNRVNN